MLERVTLAMVTKGTMLRVNAGKISDFRPLLPADRQPFQFHAEHQNQHDAQPKRRSRLAQVVPVVTR